MDATFYHVSERTVERVAEVAASSVPGCRNLDAKLAGLAGRSFPRVDVRLDQNSGTASIEAEIATTYPCPVAAVTDAVRATIIAHVRALTGVDVARVNVHVANVETLGPGTRVTWDDVACHDPYVIPDPIKVSPTKVEHPVTEPIEELTPIRVHSLADDLRDVVVPAPPTVVHPEQPEAPKVESVDTPEPVSPYSPSYPSPRPLLPISVHETEARVPFPPAPVTPWVPQVRYARAWSPRAVPTTVRMPHVQPAAPLKPVEVHNRVRLQHVDLPLRPPLREVSVTRPPQQPVEILSQWRPRHVEPPAPEQVIVPKAPAPKPLKQITIQPVVKYYDRTR